MRSLQYPLWNFSSSKASSSELLSSKSRSGVEPGVLMLSTPTLACLFREYDHLGLNSFASGLDAVFFFLLLVLRDCLGLSGPMAGVDSAVDDTPFFRCSSSSSCCCCCCSSARSCVSQIVSSMPGLPSSPWKDRGVAGELAAVTLGVRFRAPTGTRLIEPVRLCSEMPSPDPGGGDWGWAGGGEAGGGGGGGGDAGSSGGDCIRCVSSSSRSTMSWCSPAFMFMGW